MLARGLLWIAVLLVATQKVNGLLGILGGGGLSLSLGGSALIDTTQSSGFRGKQSEGTLFDGSDSFTFTRPSGSDFMNFEPISSFDTFSMNKANPSFFEPSSTTFSLINSGNFNSLPKRNTNSIVTESKSIVAPPIPSPRPVAPPTPSPTETKKASTPQVYAQSIQNSSKASLFSKAQQPNQTK